MRAVFEVPAEKGYTVSDITILDQPIQYGSQIADYLKIKLTAIAQEFDGQPNIVDGCTIQNENVATFSMDSLSEERETVQQAKRNAEYNLF